MRTHRRIMLQGGGTLLLASEGDRIGPGHLSVLRQADNDMLSYHYDDASRHGRSALGLRRLQWTTDAWPVPGEPLGSLTPHPDSAE